MSDEKIILTIRLIRSFHYRNIKNIVLHNIDRSLKVAELKELINKGEYLGLFARFPIFRNRNKIFKVDLYSMKYIMKNWVITSLSYNNMGQI